MLLSDLRCTPPSGLAPPHLVEPVLCPVQLWQEFLFQLLVAGFQRKQPAGVALGLGCREVWPVPQGLAVTPASGPLCFFDIFLPNTQCRRKWSEERSAGWGGDIEGLLGQLGA
jgi:hypothetical protein